MKKKGLFFLGKDQCDRIYSRAQQQEVGELVDLVAPPACPDDVRANPSLVKDVEVILSGWGVPHLGAEFLEKAPALKAVFYGAGSVRRMVSDALWERGIVVTSAYEANAIPVAEYCVSQILFGLKSGYQHLIHTRTRKEWRRLPMAGAYSSVVGLISMGMIGWKTLDLLRHHDVNIAVYSTSMTPERATELNLRLCGLEEIFAVSDVVSLHTPDLPETRGMIQGRHFRAMKQNSTFINSARGAVVRENEMIEVLKERQDIVAVLDVTSPEPPDARSELWELSNVFLTPHIAGSLGCECHRMGQYAINELKHYLNGAPFDYEITREVAARLA